MGRPRLLTWASSWSRDPQSPRTPPPASPSRGSAQQSPNSSSSAGTRSNRASSMNFPNHIPTRTIPPFVRSVDSSFPHEEVKPPPNALAQSRWVSYMHASGAPRLGLSPQQRELADSVWREYDEPRSRGSDSDSLLEKGRSRELRVSFIRRTRRFLMRNPFAPLFFRVFIMIDSIIALAIAADIYGNDRPCRDQSTHTLAIIVNTVAIPYTVYIAWDEFFSKPIGLRRSRSKLRLLVLDLLFIIFDSSNLSLAFDVSTGPDVARDPAKCARQWGLVVVLIIALIAWVSTFLLSLFRLMYKVDGDI